MVENWNKTVKKNDEVFHLGDLTFSKLDEHRPSRQNRGDLSLLNGKITLIPGNHDSEKTINFVIDTLQWSVYRVLQS